MRLNNEKGKVVCHCQDMNSQSDSYSLVYYLAFAFVTIGQAFSYSLFVLFQQTAFLVNLLATMFSLMILVMCLQRFKSSDFVWILLSILLVAVVGYMSENYKILFFSYVILLGAKGIPFRKIVKLHFVLMLIVCISNILGSEMGMVSEANFYVQDMERDNIFEETIERENFGYLWATDFAIHVFFILLDYWILKDARLSLIDIAFYLFVSSFLLYYCDARLAVFCIFLILLFTLFLYYKRKRGKALGVIMKYSLMLSIPSFAVLSLLVTLSYDESDIYWQGADLILSGRLSLAQDAIQEYGIPLFGQAVTFYGHGNAGFGATSYNYVDSSYIQYMIIWGSSLVCILLYLFFKISQKALNRKDLTLSLAVVLAGITGIITQFLFYFGYCILLVAFLATRAEYNDKGEIIEASQIVDS